MLKRLHLARWSVAVLPAIAAISACTDSPTNISAPQQKEIIARATELVSGVPTGKTVVVFKDATSIPLLGISLINSLGGVVTARWDEVGVAWVGGLSATALGTLRASDLVQAVGNDRYIKWLPQTTVRAAQAKDVVALPTNNPANASYFADGTQWNMKTIGADKAWAAGKEGLHSTRVAIVDTGIDYGHRELRTLVDLSASKSFANTTFTGICVDPAAPCVPNAELPTDNQLPTDSAFMDNHFHGSHVASTVASNNISVASIAPQVTLIAVKVLNWQGTGSFEGVASGIRHAAGPANADVINMSLGANVDPNEEGVPALLEMMARVIKDAEKQGTIVITAAGNDALNLDQGVLVSTPCEQATVCVSATGPLLQQDFDQPAFYTNYGLTAIEVAAPGGNAHPTDDTKYQQEDLIVGACSRRATDATLTVCRTNVDGGVYFYAFAAGTSMASPHVAAEAALIKSYNPLLTVSGIKSKILSATDDVGVKGRDIYTNYGRINVAKALGLAK
ncbi:MAG TPA: S8 family serine peptidase [Gemmatimonadaceae bacterium]|nr:S8 family serine peptidase [Gemmatimonadaceae bacterium]